MRLDPSGNMMPDSMYSAGKGFGSFRPNPSMQGRRIKVEGLQEDLKDEMICRYFRKFGVVDDWKRDESGGFGHIDFTESYMVEYCLRRPSHQIDGNSVSVAKAEPQFDEVENTGEDENMKEEANNDQEGVDDNDKEKEAETMNDVD